jgi:hypothetical protein
VFCIWSRIMGVGGKELFYTVYISRAVQLNEVDSLWYSYLFILFYFILFYFYFYFFFCSKMGQLPTIDLIYEDPPMEYPPSRPWINPSASPPTKTDSAGCLALFTQLPFPFSSPIPPILFSSS